MKKSEYDYLQSELSKLIDSNRLIQKIPHEGYRESYKKAVLDCKSRLHNYFFFHNESEVSEE